MGSVETPDTEAPECWCCGQRSSTERLVHLGSHPEVRVCLRCAHFLRQRALAREDELHPSVTGRVRDELRRGRQLVMDRDWHQRPAIGPALRWLGRYLP